MKSRRKIAVIGSTRASYGYKRKFLKKMLASDSIDLQYIVTGIHLLPEHGLSVREIEKDQIPIAARVDMMVGGDSPSFFAAALKLCASATATKAPAALVKSKPAPLSTAPRQADCSSQPPRSTR